jgi:hypothetical protein
MFTRLVSRSRGLTWLAFWRGQRKSCVCLLCILILLSSNGFAQSQKERNVFSFPGRTGHVRSAKGDFLAAYSEVSKPQDSAQYQFSISDASGNRLVRHDFTRSVEGAWARQSDRLYLNDFMGSTRIDCFVWTNGDNRLASLTDLLLHDPSSGPVEGHGAKPPETPENSRFELTCGSWKGENKLAVRLEGTTWAGGDFKYAFVYDFQTKRFSWY